VVAIVDDKDAQTKELLDHAAENFEIEVSDRGSRRRPPGGLADDLRGTS
jgi:hypothetical protein